MISIIWVYGYLLLKLAGYYQDEPVGGFMEDTGGYNSDSDSSNSSSQDTTDNASLDTDDVSMTTGDISMDTPYFPEDNGQLLYSMDRDGISIDMDDDFIDETFIFDEDDLNHYFIDSMFEFNNGRTYFTESDITYRYRRPGNRA